MYEINPQSCTGCGICITACESGAISIHSWSASAPHRINLSEKNCTACGNVFHFPELHLLQQNTPSDKVLCRICQHHNHSSNLYQVLTES